ncbi:MAG: SDR family oxidoreductase [Ignavibacteria bacterium]|nr:SDR family oxidoreductase [Ignavibacteria bacterium]
MSNLVNSYKSSWKDIDLIINNAGVFPLSRFKEISESDWDKTFSINLKSVFFLCQKFSDIFNDGGNIINISSIGGLEIWKNRLLYNVSKSALITLTKSLARELAPRIRVNSIAPGILQLEEKDQNNLISVEKIPLQKYGTQSNIIETIKFIINNDYLTGAIIPVDGGKILT